MSTAYHPQTDGQVERLNQQLAALLRHTVAIDQHDWPDMLPAAMMAYNSQVHESTVYRTYSDLAQLLALHADVQENIIHAQTQQTLEYNKRHKEWLPKEGDWVLVKADHYRQRIDPSQRAKIKLSAKNFGPFKIIKEVAPGAYQLDAPAWFRAHTTLPIQALEPFIGDPTHVTPRPLIGVTEEGARVERKVTAFLGRRPTEFLDGERFDYLVQWSGDIKPTWQSDHRLPGLDWARKEFVNKYKQETKTTKLPTKRELVLAIAKERVEQLKAMEKGE
ncbi:hypothetical protein CF326_g9978 [Tilletia indica]|nr:hypothetical protein CF326_g9978 [Tilletia indica]